jgi:PAS domain-containing protein
MTNASGPPEATQWLLAKNVEHLQLVLQHAGLGTFEHDLGSGTVRVTPLTCDLYGVPVRDELPLRELLAQVDPSALSDRERTFSQVLSGEKPFYELQYRVGRPLFARWLSVRGTVVFGDDRGLRKPVRVVGVVADITEQMHQKQRVQQAQAVLDAIGNSITEFRAVGEASGDDQVLPHPPASQDDDASA